MKDYWSELKLNECWSEKQRFNIIMNYIFADEDDTEDDEEEVPVGEVTNEVQKGKVSVTVTDGENGIGNVDVVLSQDGNETTYTGKTGGAGGCNVTDVPYGAYSVTATCDGYTTAETTVTVDAETVELEITLTQQQ